MFEREVEKLTNAESDKTQASKRLETDAASADTSAAVGSDDETHFVPDLTRHAEALAWSTVENPELSDGRHPLPRILRYLLIAVGIGSIALLMFVIGQRSSSRDSAPLTTTTEKGTAAPAKQPDPPVTPPASAPTTTPADADDDEYVALALSPSAIGVSPIGGFGTAGTQDKANQIALSECHASSGHDDCLLANSGKFHGCVSYAYDASGESKKWSSGSGSDADEAEAKARHRLDLSGPVGISVQCSDPPGLFKPSETASAPTETPQPEPAAAPPRPAISTGPEADQLYLRLLQQIPGTAIADPANAIAGGPKVCTSLIANGRAATNASVQGNDPGILLWQAVAIVNAATTAYCPAYAGIP